MSPAQLARFDCFSNEHYPAILEEVTEREPLDQSVRRASVNPNAERRFTLRAGLRRVGLRFREVTIRERTHKLQHSSDRGANA